MPTGPSSLDALEKMLDHFDELYGSLKCGLITDVTKAESKYERKSLLDTFFSTLDTRALDILTSDPYRHVKQATKTL
jgi:hypothetical protein